MVSQRCNFVFSYLHVVGVSLGNFLGLVFSSVFCALDGLLDVSHDRLVFDLLNCLVVLNDNWHLDGSLHFLVGCALDWLVHVTVHTKRVEDSLTLTALHLTKPLEKRLVLFRFSNALGRKYSGQLLRLL